MSASKQPPFFHSVDESRTLDRLRLKIPPRFQPNWSLHAVEIRPGAGHRVYGFFGAPTVFAGAFALYPDDICRTATDLAAAHPGAWPTFRKTPGPYAWLRPKTALAGFVRGFDLTRLPDEPWSEYTPEG